MANMSIEELIEEIEVYVDNCKTAGVLSSGSMIKINREELLAMLDEVRTRLPKELAESRQIIKSKESIIADAKARAERIVKDAAKEAGVMIDDNEIVALANMRADSIVKDAQKAADELNGKARETAREVQTGALQYTQNMLEGLEYMYSTIIKEEKEYFNSVLEKLKSEHKQIVATNRRLTCSLEQAFGQAGEKKILKRKRNGQMSRLSNTL